MEEGDSSLPENKIFVGNLPKGVGGSDVAHALRNCGEVAKVWFFNTEEQGDAKNSQKGPATTTSTDVVEEEEEYLDEKNKEEHMLKVQVQEGHEELMNQGMYITSDGIEANIYDIEINDADSLSLGGVLKQSAPEVPAFRNELGIETGEIEVEGDESEALFDADTFQINQMIGLSNKERASPENASPEDLEAEFACVLANVPDYDEIENEATSSLPDTFEDNEGGLLEAQEVDDQDLRVAVAEVRQLGADDDEFKKKRKALKKRIMRMQRGYNYAYVQMEDNEGYYNATRDEMRIFGICIKGHTCRVQEAWRLRTLVVEMVSPIKCLKIRHSLGAHLGSWYNFNYFKGADRVPSVDETKVLDQEKPIFVHLEFGSHQEAWKAFDLLDGAYRSGSSDLKVSWIKSEWYWKVAKKARDLSFTMSPSRAKKEAKSLEEEVAKLSEQEKSD